MNGFIYKITNRVNNKVYIGQTRFTIEHRFKQHINKANRTKVICPLHKAIKKYGAENFKIESLEEVPFEKLNEREMYWISVYNSFKSGYNATIGGGGKALYVWTDNEYMEIKSLYLSGFSLKDLCERYNVCNVTMKGILLSLGLKIRKPLDFNAYELNMLINKYKQGIGLHKLSSEYRVSLPTMKSFLKEHGVKLEDRYNILKDTQIHSSVVRDFLDGMSYKDLEDKYHADTRTIKKILVIHNININAPRGLRQTRKGAFCLTDEECLEAIKLYNSNIPVKSIAHKFSVNITTLYELFKRYNVKCSRYNHSKSVQSLNLNRDKMYSTNA